MRLSLVCVLVVSFCAAALGMKPAIGLVAGQRGPHTPEKGSAERKAILDALRVPVEKKLKQPVIFNVDHFQVMDGWAFLLGAPRRPDGGKVDYSGTPYRQAVDAGAFDDGIIALLHQVGGNWRVVQYVIGATDVPYLDWDRKYRAPRAIFPHD